MPDRPIFIIGTMRSGSTLFRLILDAHPRIAIPEETGFMGAVAATKKIPHWQHGRGWFERLGWTEQEFDARLREFYSALFERHASAQGKQRWGDKTPMHAHHMAEMATIFPDAVFVGIVRHPGAVVHSLTSKFHHELGEAVTYWDSTNRDILRHGAVLGDDRFALLRYEDLVQHPEETLQELVDWLGEPWSDNLLRHNDVHAARGAPRLSAGTTRPRDPIRAELADRWTQALDAAERDLLEARTGPLAAFLGYDPGRPGTPGPLVPPDAHGRRRLLTGTALARRLTGLETVLLEAPPEPVIMPDQSAVELARRLQQVEATLARMRALRAVRWSMSARRAERRVTGLGRELLQAVQRGSRRRGQSH